MINDLTNDLPTESNGTVFDSNIKKDIEKLSINRTKTITKRKNVRIIVLNIKIKTPTLGNF